MKRPAVAILRDLRTAEDQKKRARLTLHKEMSEWFHEALEEELRLYQERQPHECAFNRSHDNEPFRVSHYGRSDLNDLMSRFIVAHPGCETLRPREVWLATYSELWRTFHAQNAKLRILCATCHRAAHPQYVQRDKRAICASSSTPTKTIDQVLVPYSEKTKSLTPHPWLDIKTWMPAPRKGDYVRKLGDRPFQLYARHRKWLYVYKGKFSGESYESLNDVLKASYHAFGDEIRKLGC